MTEHWIELAVLAKYMQVLSSDFLARFPEVINIHHSFLPAFKVLSRITGPGSGV